LLPASRRPTLTLSRLEASLSATRAAVRWAPRRPHPRLAHRRRPPPSEVPRPSPRLPLRLELRWHPPPRLRPTPQLPIRLEHRRHQLRLSAAALSAPPLPPTSSARRRLPPLPSLDPLAARLLRPSGALRHLRLGARQPRRLGALPHRFSAAAAPQHQRLGHHPPSAARRPHQRLARHQRSVLEPRWECTLYRGDCSVAPLLLWLIPPPIFWIIQAFGQTSTFGNAPAFGQPSSFGGGGGAFGTSTVRPSLERSWAHGTRVSRRRVSSTIFLLVCLRCRVAWASAASLLRAPARLVVRCAHSAESVLA